jgi:hypothetical protein
MTDVSTGVVRSRDAVHGGDHPDGAAARRFLTRIMHRRLEDRDLRRNPCRGVIVIRPDG